MIQLVLATLCVVVSFCLSSRKMRIKAMAQVVLAVLLFALVLFILPNAPFGYLLENCLGEELTEIVHSALEDIQRYGVSVVSIINFAILFVTLLSIFDIAEFVQRHKSNTPQTEKVQPSRNDGLRKEKCLAQPKFYLMFCRLLN